MNDSSLFNNTQISGPPNLALHELKDGQRADCFALLSDRQSLTTREGKPFYRITLRNRLCSIHQPIWSDSPWFDDCRQHWKIGDFFKIRAVYREDKRYGGQLDIEKVRLVSSEDHDEGFDPSDFHERSRFDPDEMFTELTSIAEEQITHASLKELVLKILDRYQTHIKQMPAATRYHHAFAGGYLEHTLSVTRTSVYLAEKYGTYYPNASPPLDRSLIVAGAILHDIGKLRELAYDPEGSRYTAEGLLIGHILMGRDLVREMAASIEGLPEKMMLRLEHIIVAHQNLPEWGSPKLPQTPESLLVHYADDMDAKIHMMMITLENDTSEETFTTLKNPLRRDIYRETD